NVREIPRRQRSGSGTSEMSAPRKTTWPAVGRSTPETRWKSVVLPAPFGPMIARSSPGPTERSTSATARSAPNERESLRASRSGVIASECWLAREPSSGALGVEPTSRGADDATGQEDHHEDEDPAREDHPVLGVARQDLLDQDEHHRADDRTDKGADAADDHHHE